MTGPKPSDVPDVVPDPSAPPYVPSSEMPAEGLDALEKSGLWTPPEPAEDPAVEAARLLETPTEPDPDSGPVDEVTPQEEEPSPVTTDGSEDATEEPDVATEDGTADETFTVTLTLPNGDGENGLRNAGTIELELPNQETRDALRHVINRSARADRWERVANERQQDADAVAFLEESPLEGMHWMAQEKPEVARTYATEYFQANPREAITIMQSLGYEVGLTVSEEQLTDRAELAKFKNQRRVEDARVGVSQQGVQRAFVEKARGVVGDLAQQLNLNEGSERFEIFATAASRKLGREFKGRIDQATESDMMLALQDTVREFGGKRDPVTDPHHSDDQPRDAHQKFAAREAKRKRHASVAGGAPATVAVGAVKAKPGETLAELNARLESGGR